MQCLQYDGYSQINCIILCFLDAQVFDLFCVHLRVILIRRDAGAGVLHTTIRRLQYLMSGESLCTNKQRKTKQVKGETVPGIINTDTTLSI